LKPENPGLEKCSGFVNPTHVKLGTIARLSHPNFNDSHNLKPNPVFKPNHISNLNPYPDPKANFILNTSPKPRSLF